MLIALLLSLLGNATASANGPAWVAEVSAVSAPKVDALAVTVPLGSHVAVAVYNTDAVDPQPPAGVTATVRVMWFENRTVFAGLPGERDAAVPYYLPEPKDCPPTGAWVVELEPQAVGAYVVPVACNSNTVTVNLTCVDLPESAIGYGFYSDYVRFPDPLQGPAYYADMAAHGMNTFTPYARELPAQFGVDNHNAAALLAWHIETGLRVGLVDKHFPLLCLSAGEAAIQAAKPLATQPWPELIAYNCDEPGRERAAEVKASADAAHAAGLLSGTAIDGAIAQDIGDPLDVWVIHMDSMSDAASQAAQDKGKQRWLYNCALRGSNAALHRYMTGVYTWAVAPEVCLIWTYAHDPGSRIKPDGTWDLRRVYDTATCDAQGSPLPTVALEGLADGIVDSRLLQDLERANTPEGNAYLAQLRAQVPLTFWPKGENRDASSYVWDVPDLAVPPIDLSAMRREVMRLRGAAE